MKVTMQELRFVTNQLLDYLEETGSDKFEIKEDYYYWIEKDEVRTYPLPVDTVIISASARLELFGAEVAEAAVDSLPERLNI